MRCLLCTLALVLFAGCRSQTTAMTNPFLAPDRVPPPATRTLLPGTAQPYYPGDPVPNSPAIGAPPVGFAPRVTPTYAPQPAGIVPPGGWNTVPQPIPNGSSSRNGLPTSIQQASAAIPVTGRPQIQIQPDQHALRFAESAPLYQQPTFAPATGQTLLPDPSALPTPQQGASPYPNLPYPNQIASFQTPLPQQPFVQQNVPIAEPREVRIRAISSANLPSSSSQTTNGRRSRDGFRPQGSNRVRKPTMGSRLTPRRRESAHESADRFGFDPQYQWVRGQLQYAEATGLWSLRYVPSQGYLPSQSRADRLDGKLTIANPQVLGDLQPGDFVQLRGRVDQVPGAGSTAAPVYNVSVVQRQRI